MRVLLGNYFSSKRPKGVLARIHRVDLKVERSNKKYWPLVLYICYDAESAASTYP